MAGGRKRRGWKSIFPENIIQQLRIPMFKHSWLLYDFFLSSNKAVFKTRINISMLILYKTLPCIVISPILFI